MLSAEGGRQGDPLMPFFFSLAIKPLVNQLAEKFAVSSAVVDKDGTAYTRRFIWAYLDDINLSLKQGVSAKDVFDFLLSDDVRPKYNLSVNVNKSAWLSKGEMEAIGCKTLGSWVGGPDTDHSGAVALIDKQVQKLAARVPLLKHIPLQDALLILRYCFYPVCNHLLRTTHPDVGVSSVRQFDDLIANTVLSWARDPSLLLSNVSRDIMCLPIRLHGLGMFSQVAIKPIAAASGLVLSLGVLRNRHARLSDRQLSRYDSALAQCATNLNMLVPELISDDHCFDPEVQRRACEIIHERSWKSVMDRLPSDAERTRFLEGCGVLSRSWLHAIPFIKCFELSDGETRYAIRRTLHSNFDEAVSNSGFCARCGREGDNPAHHLACTSSQAEMTVRHTCIKNALAHRLQEVYRGVKMEQSVGSYVTSGLNTTEVIADIVVPDIQGAAEYIDTVITSVVRLDDSSDVTWPTDADVEQALATERSNGMRRKPLFFWEDHSDEEPHPDVIRARKWRELATAATVGRPLRNSERLKTNKYNKVNVVVTPVALTAQGCVGGMARDLFDKVLRDVKPKDDLAAKSKYQKDVFGHLGVILVRHAARMHHAASVRAN